LVILACCLLFGSAQNGVPFLDSSRFILLGGDFLAGVQPLVVEFGGWWRCAVGLAFPPRVPNAFLAPIGVFSCGDGHGECISFAPHPADSQGVNSHIHRGCDQPFCLNGFPSTIGSRVRLLNLNGCHFFSCHYPTKNVSLLPTLALPIHFFIPRRELGAHSKFRHNNTIRRKSLNCRLQRPGMARIQNFGIIYI